MRKRVVCSCSAQSNYGKDRADESSDEESRGDGSETRRGGLEREVTGEYQDNVSAPRKLVESTGFLKVIVILFGC